MKKLPRLAAIVSTCLLLVFCGAGGNGNGAKSPPESAASGSAAAVSPSRQSPPAAQEPTKITVAPQSAPQATAKSSPAAHPAQAAEFSGRETEYLMQSGLSSRVIPSDDRIGPLQDRYAQDAETRRMYRLVDEFLRSLSNKTVVEESILPDSAPFLARRLRNDLDAGYLPESWRIGRIEIPDPAAAHMRVLISGSPGSAAGDIFLVKSSDRWYISGIQVDFAQLATPPAESKPVEPGTPIWMNNAQ